MNGLRSGEDHRPDRDLDLLQDLYLLVDRQIVALDQSRPIIRDILIVDAFAVQWVDSDPCSGFGIIAAEYLFDRLTVFQHVDQLTDVVGI